MYAKIGVDKAVQLEAAADGKGKNEWQLGTVDAHYKVLDSNAPKQVGLANLAFGKYKAGDTISRTRKYGNK